MRNKTNSQYCILWIEQDIFDTWGVCKISGKAGTRGKHSWYPCEDRNLAAKLLGEMEYAVRNRGYVYDDVQYAEYFALRPQTVDEVLCSESH